MIYKWSVCFRLTTALFGGSRGVPPYIDTMLCLLIAASLAVSVSASGYNRRIHLVVGSNLRVSSYFQGVMRMWPDLMAWMLPGTRQPLPALLVRTLTKPLMAAELKLLEPMENAIRLQLRSVEWIKYCCMTSQTLYQGMYFLLFIQNVIVQICQNLEEIFHSM